jgi:hypothetical protein
VCDNTIQVRRLAFWNYAPSILDDMEINILKYDDTLINSFNATELAAYIANTSAYSIIPWKAKLDPTDGWAVPFVTKHKYKIHWRNGLDFT